MSETIEAPLSATELAEKLAEANAKIAELNSLRNDLARQVKEITVTTEPRYACTVNLFHPAFGKALHTIRADPGEGASSFRFRLKAFLKSLTEDGWCPEASARPTNGKEATQTAAPENTPLESQGEIKEFAAEYMDCTISKGREIWKVHGGPFKKYGVTVWPEVWRELGWDVKAINANGVPQTYRLDGYVAQYLEVDAKPKKVTRLIEAKKALQEH